MEKHGIQAFQIRKETNIYRHDPHINWKTGFHSGLLLVQEGLNITSYGRPKKVDEESVLQLIAQAKKITQRDLQLQTGLKKNTLSGYIKKWREAGRIQTEKVRQGSITLTLISPAESPANLSIESQSIEGSPSESRGGAAPAELTESAERVKPEEPSESGVGAEPEKPAGSSEEIKPEESTELGKGIKPEKPVKAPPKSVSMGLNFVLAFDLRKFLRQTGMSENFFLDLVRLLGQKSEKEVIQTLLNQGHPIRLIQRSFVNVDTLQRYLRDHGGEPESIVQLLTVFQALPQDLLNYLEREVRKRWK